MPDADDIARADKQMGFAERNAAVQQLRRARDDEKRVAILFELGSLVRVLGVLDRQIVQVELPLDAVQKLAVRLEQADPHDMPLLARPLASLLDGNVGDAAAIGIDARRHDAGPGQV